jgi:hypothetical protein
MNMENENVQMRVELIKHPELKGLTKMEIDRFREDYRDYKERVEQQGSGSKPVSKYMCVPVRLRKSIGYQIGCKYEDLTVEKIWQKIDSLSKVQIQTTGIDPEKIFKGLKMVPPKRRSEIKKRIQDYVLKIVDRLENYGIEKEIYDPDQLNFRKKAFSKYY